MQKLKKLFVIIPLDILAENKLSLNEAAVLGVVNGYNAGLCECFVSNDYLARVLSISSGTVKRAIKRLVELNLLLAEYVNPDGKKTYRRLIIKRRYDCSEDPEVAALGVDQIDPGVDQIDPGGGSKRSGGVDHSDPLKERSIINIKRKNINNDLNSNNEILNSEPKKRGRKTGIALPYSRELITPETYQKALDGVAVGDRAWLDRQIEKMGNSAADKGRVSKDWAASLRNWLDNATNLYNDRPTGAAAGAQGLKTKFKGFFESKD